jgi:hypothetical protein
LRYFGATYGSAVGADKARVIVVFQTDGQENASREYKIEELRDLIERRKAEGWQFMFLGADIDAYETAGRFGILKEAALSYSGKRSLRSMTAAAESALPALRRGRPCCRPEALIGTKESSALSCRTSRLSRHWDQQ